MIDFNISFINYQKFIDFVFKQNAITMRSLLPLLLDF